MRLIKLAIYLSLAGLVMFIVVINADAWVKPRFEHPQLTSQFLGQHYFINDLAGVSPQRAYLPEAFIVSHSARAAVVVTDAQQTERLAPADDFGLMQDDNIKGWGALPSMVKGEGVLLLYYYHTFLVGEFRPPESLVVDQAAVNQDTDKRHLKIRVPWRARHAAFGGVTITTDADDAKTVFDIALGAEGRFWIETQPPPSDGFPITFEQRGFLPGEIRVGADRIIVDDTVFSLSTRDMHSLAMTELDGDENAEFSIVRGGMRGKIGQIAPQATDMLIDSHGDNGRAKNITAQFPGFSKQGCPGRQSAWVDIDSDGDLDLYVSCGRPKPPTAQFPNQLFENTGTGFIESAARFGINFENYGAFRFIDWDGDLDPDLWWADADGSLRYYENNNNRFVLKDTFEGSWHGNYRPPQLLIQDLTDNGLPDLFVSHPDGNLLLVSRHDSDQGSIEMLAPATIGLPEKTNAAHWVDIDLDGRVDLLTAMHGIYFSRGSLVFTHSKADITDAGFIQDARLVSFAGVTGRKFLLAYRSCLPGKLCGARRVLLSHLREFLPLPLNWLQSLGLIEPYDWSVMALTANAHSQSYKEFGITLEGSRFNPQAIGGRVVLNWAGHKQGHWVAESDSSLYSRADLSIYFSLPREQPVTGHAYWPDGCSATFDVSDELSHISVKRPAGCTDLSP